MWPSLGSGTPVVLLHGFPQTRLMWRHVAADLAATGHTVICPDLRGYGASDKPDETGPEVYAKRTMARDIVRLAAALGHDRFALAGHDRGALVAFRAALDHPEAVTRVALLDILPTLDMWDSLHGTSAAVGFHLYLLAQPPGLPEQLLAGEPRRLFRPLPRHLDPGPGRPPAGDPRRLPLRLGRRHPLDHRRLPRHRRYRRHPRHRRPRRGTHPRHARHRPPAGLGRRPRLRRGGPVAVLGPRPAPPDGDVRALHGGGGAGDGGGGDPGVAGPVRRGPEGRAWRDTRWRRPRPARSGEPDPARLRGAGLPR